jgi:type I restriction enzyme S subunit
MEVKAGYKQTEVGLIPKDWEIRKLNLCAQLRSGIAKNSSLKVSNPIQVHYLRVANVQDGFLDLTEMNQIEIEKTDLNRFSVLPGDVLMNEGGDRDKLGRGSIWSGEFNPCVHQNHVFVIRCNSKIKPKYLTFWTRSQVARQFFITAGSQTTNLASINKTALGQLPVPLPPLPEQQAIANALSDADALIESLDQLIEKKRQIKQGVMQELLTGKRRLPGFSGEWERKKLQDFGKCLRGVSYKGDSDLSTHDTFQTKRLLRSNNIQNDILVTDEVQFVNAARVSSQQILQVNDILICMANGSKALVGKAGFFTLRNGYEYTFGAFMGCFRTYVEKANPAFVFYLFLTGRYREYINNLLAGSSINNLRPSSIESLEFLIPKPLEQTAIAKVLTEIDTEIVVLEQRREKALALKQAMMQDLLTGKVRLV